MHKILIVPYYIDKNIERNKELIYCLEKNLQAGFDSIFILSEVDTHVIYSNVDKNILNNYKGNLYFKKIDSRPSFNDFFRISHLDYFKDYTQKLFFISNSDIYFDDLGKVEDFYAEVEDKKYTVLALTRWDILQDGSSVYLNRADSQDSWIFYDKIDFFLKKDFNMGVLGCDCGLSYALRSENYNVLNPSETIKTYHYHISNIRNYNEHTRLNIPYLRVSSYESLVNQKQHKKIISFSLYGNNPKYCVGAIKNAKLAKHIYPDWICRFYLSKDVDISWIIELKKHKNVEIFIVNDETNKNGMFWRFFPMADDSVDFFMSRDCDSRLCMREKNAVDEWLMSDKKFHIMRDHPYHGTKILGGMFGFKKGCFENFSELYNKYIKPDIHDADQHFLQDVLYPIIKDNCMVHDEFFDHIPFPTLRSQNKKFVGEIYDENDARDPNHYKLIP